MLNFSLNRKFVSLFSFCIFSLGCTILAFGQSADWEHMKTIVPRNYVCGLCDTTIQIDGKLDEPAWKDARWTEDFVDIEGSKKPLPKLRTRAKMLWDKEYFYIAAELMEPHLQGTLTQHDAVIFQDNDFEVFIDPNSDNHQYFELELNTLNTTWDLFLPRPYKDGGSAEDNWEFTGLKTGVHLDGTVNDPTDQDKSWSVEIAIPWSSFSKVTGKSGAPSNGDQWRIDFSRVEWQFEVVDGKYQKVPKTKEDNWVWSPQGIIDMHRPERWGFVQFSSDAPDKTEFKLDDSIASREVLMELYHRQRTFHAKNNRWATQLSELEWSPEAKLALCSTLDGFEASMVVTNSDKSQELWSVRQDSKIAKHTESELVSAALSRAGENKAQLRLALDSTPMEHRQGMEFLISNMPDRDLKSLTSEFLVEEVRLAYLAWQKSPWKNGVPKEIFFNNILPYANINERRDTWRKDFNEKYSPLIEGVTSPSIAAARLNQKLFPLINVRYSTQRPKADQSPYESIKSGTASCTGLSVLLIDACRAVGIPARFVGTPLWSDKSGNHSWVEVWDNGWHFTGAAEPNGDALDAAWFLDRASKAKRDDAMNAIYAVSFERTPVHFPLVWDRSIDYISAVNVTDRYLDRGVKPPQGSAQTMFRVLDRSTGKRIAENVKVFDADGKLVFEGMTKDERFDANDHLGTYLPEGAKFYFEVPDGKSIRKVQFVSEPRNGPITETINLVAPSTPTTSSVEPKAAAQAIEALAKYLQQPREQRSLLSEQPFVNTAISKQEAEEAKKLLWNDHAGWIRETRAEEMKSKVLTLDNLKMPFSYELFGEKPASGRRMVISMHGGGGAPAAVNDQQWANQKRLYKLEEGVYVVPRAPTDTWDLWHQGHIDRFFDRLIENLIVLEDVDPNRIYIMGYSAGGDGVYQLAPRMADRFAAAAMMAGHPNETSPLGLRNLPFTLHMGEKDSAYNRNKIAAEWETKLADLKQSDSEGYTHLVKIHPGKGHWMDREDAVAIPWMTEFERNTMPTKIVWKQDDVIESRFYWLAVDKQDIRDRAEIVAIRNKNAIGIETKDADQVTVRLNDEMLDLDSPISITSGNSTVYQAKLLRTIGTIAKTMSERGDPKAVYSAEVKVAIPKSTEVKP